MYDFCLTLPYGALVALGGLIGFLTTGSTMSLGAGGVTGLLLMFLGACSYTEYKQCSKVSKHWAAGSLVISALLTGVMGKRYVATGAVFPAGVVAAISLSMSAFYLKTLFACQKKPQPKQE